MKKIAVIIPVASKNEELIAMTKDCIKSLQNISGYQTTEIIVESHELTAYPATLIVDATDVPFSYNGSIKRGIEYALNVYGPSFFDYWLFTNNDCIYNKNVLSLIDNAFQNYPFVSSLSPISDDHRNIVFPQHRVYNDPYYKNANVFSPLLTTSKEPDKDPIIFGCKATWHVSGYSIFLKNKECVDYFDQLFDERYIGYCSDDDYALRLTRLMMFHGLIPLAYVNHLKYKTANDWHDTKEADIALFNSQWNSDEKTPDFLVKMNNVSRILNDMICKS